VEFASSTGNQSICSWNTKSSRELFPIRNESTTVIARKENMPRSAAPKSSGQRSSSNFEPRSRERAALRADSQLEKGRSPPRPLKPLGFSGGTDSALRLVTCWSSDALRLSSSGRTGRKSPLKAVAPCASPSSSCLISSSSSQTLTETLARKSKKSG
jgi:hypothetical protein